MNFPRLLFCDYDNYIRWDNYIYDGKSTEDDLNLSDLLDYLKTISTDFPEKYLYKTNIYIEDAQYRMDIMEEIVSSCSLYSKLTDFNICLRQLQKEMEEYHSTKEEKQKQYRFLSLFNKYGILVKDLNKIIHGCKARGFRSLSNYLEEILGGNYHSLFEQAHKIEDEIIHIYSDTILAINPNKKTVCISKKTEKQNTMERLEVIVEEYFGIKIHSSFSIVDPSLLSILEKKILDTLSVQNTDVFIQLDNFYLKNVGMFNKIIDFLNLYPQLEFYLAFVKFFCESSNKGIDVCKPSFDVKKFAAKDCASPQLVAKYLKNQMKAEDIVTNDIEINQGGMFLLSGVNQGGKTIYLKTVGLTAFLAKCGCLVLCKSCSIPFYDNIFTHFMRPELLGLGRLIEETERMERIIKNLSKESLLLMNESFSSTRRRDGVEISIHYLYKCREIGCSVGFVSHYYEIPELLNSTGHCIESLITGTSKEGKRTYKIFSDISNGLACAQDIALECGMTYKQIVWELERDGT